MEGNFHGDLFLWFSWFRKKYTKVREFILFLQETIKINTPVNYIHIWRSDRAWNWHMHATAKFQYDTSIGTLPLHVALNTYMKNDHTRIPKKVKSLKR
jgi:hypothetical protein